MLQYETWKLFIYLLNARLEKMHLRIFQFYLDIFQLWFLILIYIYIYIYLCVCTFFSNT